MVTTMTGPGADLWVCAPATWDLYAGLLDARGGRNRPKYTFFDGRLTVVSPGHTHESWKTRVSTLIDIILEERGVDFHASGEVTLRQSVATRAGAEPDASYYLTNIARVVGRKDLVMGTDPPPDLVVEVVVSHLEDDAVASYRAFGVREVWVCKGGGLKFLVHGADGTYAASPVSAVLPGVVAGELAPWVYRLDPAGERLVRAEFRDWVRQTLAPDA